MRVLLDENVPHDLIPQFAGHDVLTVQGLGWAGVKNGDLLERARDTIDVMTSPSCLSAGWYSGQVESNV